ncbi:MAG: response regulator [Acidobacteria bacterium]|nr:response regulator [Acidobacteriota bacterium]
MPARILLLDDEQALLDLMQTYLSRLGHQVDAFATVARGWLAFEDQPQSFELLIADLSMPGLGGNDLFLRMLALNPNLRILVCSGLPFQVETLPAEVRAQVRFLQKPFLPNMLALAVDELLPPAR